MDNATAAAPDDVLGWRREEIARVVGDLTHPSEWQGCYSEYTTRDRDCLVARHRSKRLHHDSTVVGVAARSGPSSSPQVLVVYPLRVAHDNMLAAHRVSTRRCCKWDSKKGEMPVPWLNTFWLCCQATSERVGFLEHQGLIKLFKERVERQPDIAARFAESHRRYAEFRYALLTEDDRRYVEAEGYSSIFHQTGIGGLRFYNQVKCLHLHYAHFLALTHPSDPVRRVFASFESMGRVGNVVGEWIHAALQSLTPQAGSEMRIGDRPMPHDTLQPLPHGAPNRQQHARSASSPSAGHDDQDDTAEGVHDAVCDIAPTTSGALHRPSDDM